MFPRLRLMVLGSALLLAAPGAPPHAQTAEQWQEQQIAAVDKSERIMREANTHKGLLAQYQVMRYAYAGNKETAFRLIFGQYLSWYQTFIGDYPDAAASFSIKQQALPDDRPSPLSVGGFRARNALDAIPELARHYRAVFFNEAHNVPLTRTLTVQLLSRLRAEGFNYFASETLYQTDTGLQARGYPVAGSGFYTEEPIYAEMVRTALKLGFKVIAYEAESNATGDAREAEQARNIYRQVFRNHPDARLVVNAGYAHIQKSGTFLGGSSMAEHLQKISGIDPLSVEQTMLYAHPSAADDHPYYGAVMRKLHPAQPIVFLDKNGKPWSLRPGYDVSVFFPPQQLNRGRPTWLDLGGLRKPYFVDAERCQRTFPCLIQARYADEGANSIAADRLVLDVIPLNAVPDEHVVNGQMVVGSELYLRPGKYILTYSDIDTNKLFEQKIVIGTTDAADPAMDAQTPPPPATPRSCPPIDAPPGQLQSHASTCAAP